MEKAGAKRSSAILNRILIYYNLTPAIYWVRFPATLSQIQKNTARPIRKSAGRRIASMEKSKKRWFTGNGPFSSINPLTTRIQMIKNGPKIGVPIQGETLEEEEFIDGVLNYYEIARDPNYGREK